jgi:hypothetical protein
MLARSGRLPTSTDYAYELKWDGFRAIVSKGTNGPGYVTVKAVEKRLRIGQAVYGRVGRALAKGYLVNKASRDERAKKLAIGTPLPGIAEFLPSKATVLRFISDRPSEVQDESTMRAGDVISDPPTPPTEPRKDPETTVVENEVATIAAANGHPSGPPFCDQCGSQYCIHSAPEIWRRS